MSGRKERVRPQLGRGDEVTDDLLMRRVLSRREWGVICWNEEWVCMGIDREWIALFFCFCQNLFSPCPRI